MSVAIIESLLARASLRGHEVRRGIESFTHHACKALGINPVEVIWDRHCVTASMSERGRLTLANLADDARVAGPQFRRWVAYVVHELLHRKYTNFNAVPGGVDPYLFQLANAVEDAWIERNGIADALLGNIRGLLHSLIAEMVRESADRVKDWADPKVYPWSLAVYLRQYGVTVPVPGNLMPVYEEALRRLPACANSADTFALAQWVYDQIRQAAPQEQDKPQDKPQNGQQGKGKDGAGKDQAQGEPEGQGQGQGPGESAQDGPQDGSGGGSGSAPDQPADAGQSRAPAYGEVDPVEPEMNPGGAGASGRYSKEGGMTNCPFHGGTPRDGIPVIPASLKHEVRRLFENTARESFEPNRRSGSINTRSLHRIGSSDRLFQRRDEPEGIDSAVVICIDCSGSMSGGRMNIAAPVAAALIETLAMARVDVAVLCFSQKTNILKPFGSAWKPATVNVRAVDAWGSTNDFHAVRVAHEMLLMHRAQRRVCFVLTDGEGDPIATRAQVDAGSALGIQTLGIGIRQNVKHVYGRAIRVDNLNDLGKVAFDQLKRAA